MATAATPLANYRRRIMPQAQDPNAIVDGMDQPQSAGAPDDGSAIGGSGVFDDPSSDPSQATGTATTGSPYGNPSAASIPTPDFNPNDPIHNTFYQNNAATFGQGQQINNEATSQLGYYGGLQTGYQQQADAAYKGLAQQPGYTPGQAGQINVDYSKFNTPGSALQSQFLNPDEQQQIYGNPNTAVGAMQAGQAGEGAMLNQYQENLGGQYGNYERNLSGQVDKFGSTLNPAVGGLQSGLAGAQGKFSGLDAAVNDPGLAFDPNNTEKQLTDADVQEMKTAAGTRVGNQYRTAEDTLNRNALEAGNTSPLAIAAANSRLQTQEASDQGNAETGADIAAKQAQYGRAAGIEGQREGAVQTQSGMRAGASTTEEGAAQNAAGLGGLAGINAATTLGNAGINAANTIGQAGLNAANQYGQFSTNEANTLTGQGYQAANAADQTASQRAAELAGNRQQVQTGVNQTQYNQGVGSAQATAAGATNVGQAAINGMNNYRTFLTGEQGAAQQGGQNAVQQQLGAYGTQTSGLNQSTSNRASYENNGPGGMGKTGSQIFNAGVSTLFEKGGIVDEPTLGIVGEKGPELIVPIRRYRTNERQAA